MELFFLRHAKAAPQSPRQTARDSERPLTPEGVAKMKLIACGMQRLGLEFDLILSSPFQRARQTAEIAAEIFELGKKLAFSPALTPEADPEKLIAELNQQPPNATRILLVGHEPALSQMISLLTTGSRGLRLIMKKAGLCKVSTHSLRYGPCADLEWLLTPRQLAAFGKTKS